MNKLNQRYSRKLTTSGVLVGAALLVACGSDKTEVATPYDPGTATVIGEQPGGEQNVLLSSCSDAACTEARERCGADGAADVIVDDAGNVADVICYGQDVAVQEVPLDRVDGYSTDGENGAVLVLDGANDGVDVAGDLVIDGNNAVVYGEGPEVSVISGTVQLEKNNSKIRGVRIQGDVTIDKNDTKLTFCVIDGDLTIRGNNTTVAECVVYGRVEITGLNTVFVRNGWEQTDRIEGYNMTCSDNYRFNDENNDFIVQESERGSAMECVARSGSPSPQG